MWSLAIRRLLLLRNCNPLMPTLCNRSQKSYVSFLEHRKMILKYCGSLDSPLIWQFPRSLKKKKQQLRKIFFPNCCLFLFIWFLQLPWSCIFPRFGPTQFVDFLNQCVMQKAEDRMIPKKMQNKNIKSYWKISHILLHFSKVECRADDYHSLETAKKVVNHVNQIILEADLCLSLSVRSVWIYIFLTSLHVVD